MLANHSTSTNINNRNSTSDQSADNDSGLGATTGSGCNSAEADSTNTDERVNRNAEENISNSNIISNISNNNNNNNQRKSLINNVEHANLISNSEQNTTSFSCTSSNTNGSLSLKSLLKKPRLKVSGQEQNPKCQHNRSVTFNQTVIVFCEELETTPIPDTSAQQQEEPLPPPPPPQGQLPPYSRSNYNQSGYLDSDGDLDGDADDDGDDDHDDHAIRVDRVLNHRHNHDDKTPKPKMVANLVADFENLEKICKLNNNDKFLTLDDINGNIDEKFDSLDGLDFLEFEDEDDDYHQHLHDYHIKKHLNSNSSYLCSDAISDNDESGTESTTTTCFERVDGQKNKRITSRGSHHHESNSVYQNLTKETSSSSKNSQSSSDTANNIKSKNKTTSARVKVSTISDKNANLANKEKQIDVVINNKQLKQNKSSTNPVSSSTTISEKNITQCKRDNGREQTIVTTNASKSSPVGSTGSEHTQANSVKQLPVANVRPTITNNTNNNLPPPPTSNRQTPSVNAQIPGQEVNRARLQNNIPNSSINNVNIKQTVKVELQHQQGSNLQYNPISQRNIVNQAHPCNVCKEIENNPRVNQVKQNTLPSIAGQQVQLARQQPQLHQHQPDPRLNNQNQGRPTQGPAGTFDPSCVSCREVMQTGNKTNTIQACFRPVTINSNNTDTAQDSVSIQQAPLVVGQQYQLIYVVDQNGNRLKTLSVIRPSQALQSAQAGGGRILISTSNQNMVRFPIPSAMIGGQLQEQQQQQQGAGQPRPLNLSSNKPSSKQQFTNTLNAQPIPIMETNQMNDPPQASGVAQLKLVTLDQINTSLNSNSNPSNQQPQQLFISKDGNLIPVSASTLQQLAAAGNSRIRMVNNIQVADPTIRGISNLSAMNQPVRHHTVYYVRQPLQTINHQNAINLASKSNIKSTFPDPHEIRRLDGLKGPPTNQLNLSTNSTSINSNDQQNQQQRLVAQVSNRKPSDTSDKHDDPTFGFSKRPSVKVVATKRSGQTNKNSEDIFVRYDNCKSNFCNIPGSNTNNRELIATATQTLDRRVNNHNSVQHRLTKGENNAIPSTSSMSNIYGSMLAGNRSGQIQESQKVIGSHDDQSKSKVCQRDTSQLMVTTAEANNCEIVANGNFQQYTHRHQQQQQPNQQNQHQQIRFER